VFLRPVLIEGMPQPLVFLQLVRIDQGIAQGDGTNIDDILQKIEIFLLEVETLSPGAGIDDFNGAVDLAAFEQQGKHKISRLLISSSSSASL